MQSFSELRVIVRIHEPKSRTWRRLVRERKRVGLVRLLDVLAYRVVHTVRYRSQVRAWVAAQVDLLSRTYPAPAAALILDVENANDSRVVEALTATPVDFAIARCKQLLSPRVFTRPKHGVFVLHPGICPEYRNAHGGFWALAQNDQGNIGTTLLRIDRGVDTGPAFAYFRAACDPLSESALIIQDRSLFGNLDAVRATFEDILNGSATPIDTRGRPSAEWGQPWFSAWLRYRSRLISQRRNT